MFAPGGGRLLEPLQHGVNDLGEGGARRRLIDQTLARYLNVVTGLDWQEHRLLVNLDMRRREDRQQTLDITTTTTKMNCMKM